MTGDGTTGARFPVVIMGVSGCGKTTVGRRVAETVGRRFVDADDLHPIGNRRKMSSGVPLTDADRAPWLEAVGTAMAADPSTVVACSALKRSYRERIRQHAPGTCFVHLRGDHATIAARLRTRTHEFMPETLLATQFAALEEPDGESRVLVLDVRRPVSDLVGTTAEWVRQMEGRPHS